MMNDTYKCCSDYFVHSMKSEVAQLVKHFAAFTQHIHKVPTVPSLLINSSIEMDFKYI